MKNLKYLLFVICIIFSACAIKKQHSTSPPLTTKLAIADRASNALTGSEIVEELRDLNLEKREATIFNEFKKGNVPDFLRTMVRVTDTIIYQNNTYTVSYYVLPDYLALGSDDDYFLCPMTPLLAQKTAAKFGCILPTRKMVNQIWKAATVKMEPEPIPPSAKMITMPVFEHHNNLVWTQRKTFLQSNPLGALVSGHKKDVIISNLIYTSSELDRVVIYGWHYKTGKNIQPLYAGHADIYADYSHGIRLIQQTVFVNGKPMLASDILKSEELHVLMSDEGPILKARY